MTIRSLLAVSALSLMLSAGLAQAQAPIALARVETAVLAGAPRVVAWRRDLHAHPELGFAETRTAAMVADHLRALGMEVRTGVGKTGVVGVLRGGRPGGTVALRADMDALPVLEATGLPFASTATGTYMGNSMLMAKRNNNAFHINDL